MRLLRLERTPQSVAQNNQSTGLYGKHWTRANVLRHPIFWAMAPAVMSFSGFGTAFWFHQVHFAQVKGWSHLSLVSLFPLYTAIGIGAMLVSGWALDRIGTPRLIVFYQLPMVIAFTIFSYATSLWFMVIGLFLLALTSGANATLPNAFWAEFYGTRHIGSIKAMTVAVMVLGSAIGPGITGILIDLGIGIERQFIGFALYFLLASIVMWVGVQRARPSLTLNVSA